MQEGKKIVQKYIKKEIEEYYPPSHKLNKTKSVFPKVDKSSNSKFGKWNKEEKDLYFKFLQEHQEDFHTQTIRRQKKTFHEMQKVIPTRTADQCRGHHRKVQVFAQTRDIKQIIQFLMQREGRKREINVKTQQNEEKAKLAEVRGRQVKVEEQRRSKKAKEPRIEVKQAGEWSIKIKTGQIHDWTL